MPSAAHAGMFGAVGTYAEPNPPVPDPDPTPDPDPAPDPTPSPVTFDLSQSVAKKAIASLDLSGVTVLQCAVRSDDTGDFYCTQAESGSNGSRTPYETTRISRLDDTGNYIDKMQLTNGGHGTSIALEYTGGKMYVWASFQAALSGKQTFDLLRFPYKTGAYTRSSITGETIIIPGNGHKVDVALDIARDWAAVRRPGTSTETYTRVRFSDLKNKVTTAQDKIVIPVSPPTMQGYCTVDDSLFRYTGGTNGPSGDKPLISEYSWITGQLIGTYSTIAFGRNSDGSYYGNQYEPESVTMYRDGSGVPRLYAGVTLGGPGDHKWPLYSLTLVQA